MKRERRAVLRRVAGVGAMAAAGGLGYSRFAIPHDLPLPPALPGERRERQGCAGRLSYYALGSGAPLLLIHSINAAGSAYEVRPIAERMAGHRRVYAVDLPGFGFSDRSERAYTIRLYTDAILDMLDVIAEESQGGPIDALALSLSCEFLGRAATEHPDRFRTLCFVTPTGFEKGSETRRGARESAREVPGLYRAFTFPLWKQALFDLLASRRSIRFFLEKTWGSKAIDEGLLDYDYLTTHQPGAPNAPFNFVSGRLFAADIRTVYEAITRPVYLPRATRGDFQDFSEGGWLRDRPNWRVEPFDAGALLHFERLDAFMASYARFLAEPP